MLKSTLDVVSSRSMMQFQAAVLVLDSGAASNLRKMSRHHLHNCYQVLKVKIARNPRDALPLTQTTANFNSRLDARGRDFNGLSLEI